MISTNDRLPSLSALRAFEAAARLGSFTAAAQELHVTQSAVSRQVQVLEAALGTSLFERLGPRVALNAEGTQLAQAAAEAFELLRAAAARARRASQRDAGSANAVSISMLPSVAAKWFTPRLGRLFELMPELDLNIVTTREVLDLGAAGVDCAIRYGRGLWQRHRARLLMRESIIAVAAPDLVQRLGLRTPADLQRSVLLQSDNPDTWPTWARAAGLSSTAIRRLPSGGPRFSDDVSLIEACLRGVGVALGRSRLIEDELRSGRLVPVGPRNVPATFAYYVVTPEGAEPAPRVKQLIEWLVGQSQPSERLGS